MLTKYFVVVGNTGARTIRISNKLNNTKWKVSKVLLLCVRRKQLNFCRVRVYFVDSFFYHMFFLVFRSASVGSFVTAGGRMGWQSLLSLLDTICACGRNIEVLADKLIIALTMAVVCFWITWQKLPNTIWSYLTRNEVNINNI